MKKGSALLLAVLIIALFLGLASLFTKMVYNNYAGANAALVREQAFWLAEAGLEQGKTELAHNPNWYTDLPHYPEDNVPWLANCAVGQTAPLGDGSFKVVRENGKNWLYSIGCKGKGLVVLKLTFSNPPWQNIEWKEL
ncbi:MAG: hypothetical protein PHH60_05475 [Candidatus Margulisbacteria bacterium]|nr:hypothetical protein [Candidatus Margulisiibacteriota bacterium]